MSKSPNFMLPALGGAALVLGLAYGWMSRDYRAEEIAALEDRLNQAESRVSAATAKAEADAERASVLEGQLATAKSEAEARAASADLSTPAPVADAKYGLGRPALDQEVAAWNLDVLPDGRGLPVGSGDVATGEEVFADKCAACHGDFAEGVDNWPVLAGGFDTLADKDPVKTVGSYWPHLTTVWDYVHRSMPFGEAQTLTADETYAIVAYILYSNDLVDEEFVLTNENLAGFDMHNKDGFVVDDRPEREYGAWSAEPCMTNCKDSVAITMRATFLDVTPEGGGESVMNHASVSDTPTFSAGSETQVAATNGDANPNGGADADAADLALIAAGEKVFKKCKACHAVGDGAKNKTGPELNDLIGRMMGSVDGFKYSSVFQAAHDEGRVWDEAALSAFLAKPKSYMNGTKMSFGGLKKEQDVAALIAYLKTFGG